MTNAELKVENTLPLEVNENVLDLPPFQPSIDDCLVGEQLSTINLKTSASTLSEEEGIIHESPTRQEDVSETVRNIAEGIFNSRVDNNNTEIQVRGRSRGSQNQNRATRRNSRSRDREWSRSRDCKTPKGRDFNDSQDFNEGHTGRNVVARHQGGLRKESSRSRLRNRRSRSRETKVTDKRRPRSCSQTPNASRKRTRSPEGRPRDKNDCRTYYDRNRTRSPARNKNRVCSPYRSKDNYVQGPTNYLKLLALRKEENMPAIENQFPLTSLKITKVPMRTIDSIAKSFEEWKNTSDSHQAMALSCLLSTRKLLVAASIISNISALSTIPLTDIAQVMEEYKKIEEHIKKLIESPNQEPSIPPTRTDLLSKIILIADCTVYYKMCLVATKEGFGNIGQYEDKWSQILQMGIAEFSEFFHIESPFYPGNGSSITGISGYLRAMLVGVAETMNVNLEF